MDKLKVISFDVEGTLATSDFSNAVWHEGIPALYAQKNGINFEKAKEFVMEQYNEVGEQRQEWYDIKYWLRRFELGDHRPLMESHKSKVMHYNEVREVLAFFTRRCPVIILSSSTRDFLPYLLEGLEGFISRIFSSISDYGMLKSPSFYLKVCQELSDYIGEPEEILHVGDSFRYDYLNAREAGVQAFHLDRVQKSGNAQSLKNLLELKGKW